MEPDNPLQIDFDAELSSSTEGPLSEKYSCDTYIKQIAIYRAQYLNVLLENGRLKKEINRLQAQVDELGIPREAE